MIQFENTIGKEITNIQRLDFSVNYEYYSPNAIIFTFSNQPLKLIFFASDDGSSIDIKFITNEQIIEDYGIHFGEQTLNELKPNDELLLFKGNIIADIKIAEFISSGTIENDFVFEKGKFAGIELVTNQHKLLFQNNYGGWCDIDNEDVMIENEAIWRWL